ncbi:phenylacetate--CoA ligase family protein [Rhodobacteraceae bacterium 63075]|nr:phenylacetate--CoA ligase family protein [Rhodobacteraceae bacterium 63075]
MSDRLTRLAEIVAEAERRAPALAARLQGAGLTAANLARPGALESLPVLQKTELMEMQAADPPFAGYLSSDMQEVAHVFASPGPIFEPVLRSQEAHGFDLMFRSGGLGPGDIALNTWSYHLVPAGLIFDAGARATGATVIPSGPGQTELQVRLIAGMGVSAFLGSTAYFEKVAQAYAKSYGGTAGHWTLRRAFLGGEPGNWMGKRKRLEASHGITTHGAYGTADLGLVGFEKHGQPGYACNPERLVQICDPLSGAPLPVNTPGQIVVTTLARGWPMIRFGTGDLAKALEIGPDGFVTRLSAVSGRVGDGVKVREIFLYRAHAEALAAALGPDVSARIRVANADGCDRIEIALSGSRCPDAEVQESFRRITRLRADHISWHARFTETDLLEDTRDFSTL